ncbi:hypothetical protein BKA57DRAFT_474298, partial [Linnemannia elongata]
MRVRVLSSFLITFFIFFSLFWSHPFVRSTQPPLSTTTTGRIFLSSFPSPLPSAPIHIPPPLPPPLSTSFSPLSSLFSTGLVLQPT